MSLQSRRTKKAIDQSANYIDKKDLSEKSASCIKSELSSLKFNLWFIVFLLAIILKYF